MADPSRPFSRAHIEYLMRAYLVPPNFASGAASSTAAPSAAHEPALAVTGLTRTPLGHRQGPEAMRAVMQDALAGLHQGIERLEFEVAKAHGIVTLSFSAARPDVVAAALEAAYPGLQTQDFATRAPTGGAASLLLCGTPTVKFGDTHSGILQSERLIHGLSSSLEEWSLRISATRVANEMLDDMLSATMKDLRVLQDSDSATRHPVAEQYDVLLQALLEKLTEGTRQGLWHVGARLAFSNPANAAQAAALSVSVYGGNLSRPDPIRSVAWNRPSLEVPQDSPPPAPGHFAYPYAVQSLLTSSELSAYVQLPVREFPGFFVRRPAFFDVATLPVPQESVALGTILESSGATAGPLHITLSSIARHVLIAGMTGSGKTNTVLHLLEQIQNQDIPCLVLEPSKHEYRALARRGKQPVRALRAGGSQLRLNPFQILPGVSVQTHIDRLRSVFNASFAMYPPMPQVLEQCIVEMYLDNGWDLVSNENYRGCHPRGNPTLTQLYEKIDPVVQSLGYDHRITADVSAALKTRINSLRIGQKGTMLDCLDSTIDDLFTTNAILELEALGDDDEKAFVMALVLIFLAESREASGGAGGSLRHVTVIEEAHRLLTNVPTTVAYESANIRGKAVEFFCQLLAELRASGEGFVISEQIPTKLAPDVLKNTSLKIAHRIVALEDRAAMGGAMLLDDEQARHMGTLGVGNALMLTGGDDGAYSVTVPLSESFALPPSDVAGDIAGSDVSAGAGMLSWEGRRLASVPLVQQWGHRLVLHAALTGTIDPADLDAFASIVAQHSKSDALGDKRVAAAREMVVGRVIDRLGRLYGWSFEEAEALESEFQSRVAKGAGNAGDLPGQYTRLVTVDRYPFSGCERVCENNRCLYRYHVSPFLYSGAEASAFDTHFASIDDENAALGLMRACGAVAKRTQGYHEQRGHYIAGAMCYFLQKVYAHPNWTRAQQSVFVERVLDQVQQDATDVGD